jgi:hypothetical protein
MVVVVTGAARGLGAGVAAAVVAGGGRVLLTGLEPEALDALATRLGPAASACAADVTDRAALHRAMGAGVAAFGRIDAVVANAGLAEFALLADMAPERFDRLMAVNVTGVFNTLQAATPHLKASRGYFLAVSSLSAAFAPPGLGAYGASKRAVEALCDTLRPEFGAQGVGVGVGYFNWLDTDMVREAQSAAPFRAMIGRLSRPVRGVSTVAQAAAAVVAGIVGRKSRVVMPLWLHYTLAARWFIAAHGARMAADVPEIERLFSDRDNRG